ncbi:DNA translocase FtsK [Deinococcus sp.]|uniref:FtsK/SpoIIIE family DNA translocase n=1 Tax=Deinococcus sp. TaxID=47478 RepID=UPI0025B81B7B|nr:DNA translocase FtsK [Deinococcus sp.]
MSKAVKTRTPVPQASRFDGEALGLVLFALGIFLAVTLFAPSSGKPLGGGAGTAIGLMDLMRAFLVGWLGWGAYLLPIIPFSYGVMVFLGRSMRGLSRRTLGAVIVVLSLLALHEVFQPGAAGLLAARSIGILAGAIGYVAALLPLVSLTLGLEIMLSLRPLHLLKTLFRWISRLLGGATTRVQGVIESRQEGQGTARARQDVRLNLAAHARELSDLRKIFPADPALRRQYDEIRAAQKTVKSQDETGLGHLARDLESWKGMTGAFVANAARDLREAVLTEALDAAADAEALLKEVNAGRHELSVPLASTQASGELEVVRRRAVQDLQRLAFRGGRLERERKAAEKALAKADQSVLAREQAAHQGRVAGWAELQKEFVAWSQLAHDYPGWPDLAAAFDRAPTNVATQLAQAIRSAPETTLADQALWRTRLNQAQEALSPPAQPVAAAKAALPVMDMDFGSLQPGPAPRPTLAPEGKRLQAAAPRAGQHPGSLENLEAGLDPWDDEEDMPFGPPATRQGRSLSAVPARTSPLLGGGGVQAAENTVQHQAAPWDDEVAAPKNAPRKTVTLPGSAEHLAPSQPQGTRQGALPLALPGYELLDPVPAAALNTTQMDVAARQRANLIDETLRQFNLQARVVDFARGPTVTRYEIEPAPGEKISRIASLSNDLARALAVGGVRIEAPVPGKSVIGLEVPNAEREPVTFHQAAEAASFRNTRAKLPIILGKSIDGELMVGDLVKMPHLLVAGSTGSGKSVCVNTLITSLLFKYLPGELRFLMIDPKMVELTPYDGIPHLVRSVVTNPVDAAGVLLGAVAHMERRYKMMSAVGAKNLEQYNAKMRQVGEVELPHLVIIIDELADLMITSPKEVESAIMRLAQMARATGMHLILATQRPSVDILTSLIKVNVPARIAFAVSSSHDSRTILDSVGAERLTGMGDMLFYQPGLIKPLRLQGPYISEAESVRITEELRRQVFEDTFVEAYGADFEGGTEASGPSADKNNLDFSDPYLRQAAQICIEEGQGSVSRLQRRLSVGHARAGKLMDLLEAMGIVSKHQGSKPREVLITEAELPEYFGK